MVSCVSFVILALAGMVVASQSPLELGVETKLEQRATTVYCDDNSLTMFVVDS